MAHGLCLTAGFELSLACDLLWAARGVQFGLVEKVVGITPLMGGTQRVADRAGAARARELVMTGGLYTAETLHEWGVVNRVLDRGDLLDTARRFAAGLAAGPDPRARRDEGGGQGAVRPRGGRRGREGGAFDLTSVRDA